MESEPSAGPRHSDRIRKELEDEILNGTLSPGTRLDEEALALRFSVSRTPIRETLMQLSTTGLVELRPRQSAVVADLTAETIIEMFEMSLELEKICARLAARRMSEEERQELTHLHEGSAQLVARGDAEGYVLANRELHHAIYSGTHNSFIEQQASILFTRLLPYRRKIVLRPGQVARSHREHGDIVAAIVAGDDGLAESVMMKHASLQDGAFLDFIALLSHRRERPQPGPSSKIVSRRA